MAEYIRTFILWLIAVLCILAIPYFSMCGAADVQAERGRRERAYFESQLDKCRAGNHCRVDGYQFLTIAERQLPR